MIINAKDCWHGNVGCKLNGSPISADINFRMSFPVQPRIDLRLGDPKVKLSFLPETTVKDAPAVVIKVVDKMGRGGYERYSFHKTSGRLLRVEQISSIGPTLHTDFHDYGEVAGVPYARKLTITSDNPCGLAKSTVTQEIRVAEKLAPKLFEQPADEQN